MDGRAAYPNIADILFPDIGQRAQGRLSNRFAEEQRFGSPMKPTVSDLIDYQLATQTQWPERPVTVAEATGMQLGTGGMDMAIAGPTSRISDPLSMTQAAIRDSVNKASGTAAGEGVAIGALPGQLERKRSVLADFLGDGGQPATGATDRTIREALAFGNPLRVEKPDKPGAKWGMPFKDEKTGLFLQEDQNEPGSYKQASPPPAGTGAGDVPDQVKQAQQLVLKFAQQVNPQVAMMLAIMPDSANNPAVQSMLAQQIPAELKPAYEQAIKILNDFYKVPAQPMGSTGAVTKNSFMQKHGLTPSTGTEIPQ